MRVILLTLEAAVTIEPLLALANELHRRGHEPVFALPRGLEEFIASSGFECRITGPNLFGVA